MKGVLCKMKTNYELLNEVFEESEILSMKNIGEILFILHGDEEVIKIFKDTVEELEEPVSFIISCFYENNERAKSKEYDKELERNLNRIFRNILKAENDKEVLSLVKAAKEIKCEKDSLKEDLEWTKEVAKNLYLIRDLFNKKIEGEVE